MRSIKCRLLHVLHGGWSRPGRAVAVAERPCERLAISGRGAPRAAPLVSDCLRAPLLPTCLRPQSHRPRYRPCLTRLVARARCCSPRTAMADLCPASAPFFGFMGAAVALIFASESRAPSTNLAECKARRVGERACGKLSRTPRTPARASCRRRPASHTRPTLRKSPPELMPAPCSP